MNTETSLLDQKTSEYDNLPGMVLGLDGWILRAVPKDQRTTFLKGYEKILRIVMHPDRVSVEVQKKSRENFLQAVNEAIRFMTADDFAYDTTADSVPTRKNPLVTLKQEILRRDEIIERVAESAQEPAKQLKEQLSENERLRQQIKSQGDYYDAELSRAHWLRRSLIAGATHWCVPITFKYFELDGCFIEFKAKTGNVEFLDRLLAYSGRANFNLDTEWSDRWISDAHRCGHFSQSQTLAFREGACRTSPKSIYRIRGAFTILHFCEFIRKHLPPQKSGEALGNALQDFSMRRLMGNDHEIIESACRGLLLPFVSEQMILLLVEEWSNTLKFFFVEHNQLVKDIKLGVDRVKEAIRSNTARENQTLRKDLKTLKRRANSIATGIKNDAAKYLSLPAQATQETLLHHMKEMKDRLSVAVAALRQPKDTKNETP